MKHRAMWILFLLGLSIWMFVRAWQFIELGYFS